MKKAFFLLGVAILLAVTIFPVNADAYQLFTDEATFLAAAPGAQNISFAPVDTGAILPDTLSQTEISVNVMNFPMPMNPTGMSMNTLSVTAAHQLVVSSGPWSSPTFINFTPVNSFAFGLKLTNQMSEGMVGLLTPLGIPMETCFSPGASGFIGLLSDNGQPLSAVGLSIAGGITPGTIFFDKVYTQTAPTPIPSALWLLGSGLVGLVTLRKRLAA